MDQTPNLSPGPAASRMQAAPTYFRMRSLVTIHKPPSRLDPAKIYSSPFQAETGIIACHLLFTSLPTNSGVTTQRVPWLSTCGMTPLLGSARGAGSGSKPFSRQHKRSPANVDTYKSPD